MRGRIRRSVRFSGGETAVTVTITDEGIGFAPARLNNDRTHIGLTSMQERAKELGGTLTIHAQPGTGTEIKIVVPIGEEEHSDG